LTGPGLQVNTPQRYSYDRPQLVESVVQLMVQLGQHKAFLEALPGKGRWLPAVVNLHRRDSCCCCCSQGGHACTGGGDDGPAHPSRAMPAGEDTWDEGMLASAVALLNEHHKYQAADHLQVQSASHAAPSQFTCQHERMHAAHCHRIKGCLSHCHRIKGSLSYCHRINGQLIVLPPHQGQLIVGRVG